MLDIIFSLLIGYSTAFIFSVSDSFAIKHRETDQKAYGFKKTLIHTHYTNFQKSNFEKQHILHVITNSK